MQTSAVRFLCLLQRGTATFCSFGFLTTIKSFDPSEGRLLIRLEWFAGSTSLNSLDDPGVVL